MAKKYQPDMQPDTNKAWANEKMKQLNHAYEILKDLDNRRDYDKSLQPNQRTKTEDRASATSLQNNNGGRFRYWYLIPVVASILAPILWYDRRN